MNRCFLLLSGACFIALITKSPIQLAAQEMGKIPPSITYEVLIEKAIPLGVEGTPGGLRGDLLFWSLFSRKGEPINIVCQKDNASSDPSKNYLIFTPRGGNLKIFFFEDRIKCRDTRFKYFNIATEATPILLVLREVPGKYDSKVVSVNVANSMGKVIPGHSVTIKSNNQVKIDEAQ